MKTIFFPLSLLFLFLTGCEQKVEPTVSVIGGTETFLPADTLAMIAENERQPSQKRLNAYFDLVSTFETSDYRKALQYGHCGIMLAQEKKNEIMEGKISNMMCNTYFRAGIKDTALLFANKTLELAQKLKDEELEAMAENLLGKVYYAQLMYDKALEHAQNSLKYFEKENDKNAILVTANDIGTIYSKLLNDEMALHYFQICEKIGEEMGSEYILSYIYINYIQVYNRKKDFPAALDYGHRAANYFRENSNPYLLSFALEALAEVYSNMGEYENELKCSEECLRIAEELEMKSRMVSALNAMAEAQLNMKQYAKSEASALRALELDTIGTVTRDLLLTLTKNYIKTNQHAKALLFLEKYNKHLSSFTEDDFRQRTSALEVSYETAKKEFEIERQRQVIVRQNLQRSVLAGGVAVCIVFLALLWYMLRLRNRRNLALTERNAALADINVTKDKFFNIISHDLKNPAVAQRDALRVLVEHAREWDADKLAGYHEKLLKVAEEQSELIYNLLGWAQQQTGRIAYEPVAFCLSTRIRADIALLCDLADHKGIALTVQMPDHALITGDSNMLSTVVRNLLINAIKFTPAGGTVTLNISPSGDRKGSPLHSEYTVSVADTGIGMTPEQIQNLFRLDKAHSRTGTAGEHGTGLGLIVCKEFLEKHSSVLHVESEEGKGSRFWFEV